MAKPILLVRVNTRQLTQGQINLLKESIKETGINDDYHVVFTNCGMPDNGFTFEVHGNVADVKTTIKGEDLKTLFTKPKEGEI